MNDVTQELTLFENTRIGRAERYRSRREEESRAEYARYLQAVSAKDPSEASYQSYLKAVLRASAFRDSTNAFLINLNQGSHDSTHVAAWDEEHYRTIGRLIREGILTPELESCGIRFKIHAARFPPDDRDLYAVCLNYIAHYAATDHLSEHTMLYRLDIYRKEDRERVLGQLQQEGYIGSALRILKRPTDATAEYRRLNLRHAVEADFSIVRADDSAHLFVTAGACFHVGADEGYGESGPVNQPGWTWDDEQDLRGIWPAEQRNLARTAALQRIAEIAEKAIEHYPHRARWKAHVPATAQWVHRWCEGLLGAAIPKLLPAGWGDRQEQILQASKQAYRGFEGDEPLNETGHPVPDRSPGDLEKSANPAQMPLF